MSVVSIRKYDALKDRMLDKYASLKDRLRDSLSEIKSLMGELDDARKENLWLTKDLDKSNRDLKQSESKLEEYYSTIEDLKKALESSNERFSDTTSTKIVVDRDDIFETQKRVAYLEGLLSADRRSSDRQSDDRRISDRLRIKSGIRTYENPEEMYLDKNNIICSK
jgi:peptidoglycan hydrolase CwlO-like protein